MTRHPLNRAADLLVAALVLGVLAWIAIVRLAGWWPLAVVAYLYLLAIAAVASVGGIAAAMRWRERRRTDGSGRFR